MRVASARRLLTGTVAGLLGLAGCGGVTAPSGGPSSSATPAAFTNPVHDLDFPDPMIVRDGDRYLAVATNGNGSNVQVATSPDLVHWTQAEDALPELPDWSSAGKVWAPEIAVHSSSRSVLYYTTIAPDGMRQCISVAEADAVAGPYVDSTNRPLVCDSVEQGGSIDPHPFQDEDGRRYLYWKNDGNAVGAATWLWVQRLSDDGLRLIGEKHRLLRQDLEWEGSLIEAPFVVRSGDTYHLFYSANDYGSWSYAEGHATGPSPLGPFRKDPDPVLASNDVAAGPGGGAVVTAGGRSWMAYHAWAPDAIGSAVPGRQLWLSEITFGPDRTVVEPPLIAHPDLPTAAR